MISGMTIIIHAISCGKIESYNICINEMDTNFIILSLIMESDFPEYINGKVESLSQHCLRDTLPASYPSWELWLNLWQCQGKYFSWRKLQTAKSNSIFLGQQFKEVPAGFAVATCGHLCCMGLEPALVMSTAFKSPGSRRAHSLDSAIAQEVKYH